MKKGISLIVLVITIIVMIILAASVVITLSNTGVINRASQAVDLTNESAVQDLAALTWADAYMDNKRGTELVNEVTTKLGEQGVTADKWNITVTDTGVSVTSKESGNVTPTTTLGSLVTTAADYGKTVNYEANGVTDWKVFYEDETKGYVYLIASEELSYDKVPTSLNTIAGATIVSKKVTLEDNTVRTLGKVYWIEGSAPNEVATIQNPTVWLANWSDYSVNINGRCASYFLDETYWTSFKNTSASYKDYVLGAIGTPTAEMFVASWNAKRAAINDTTIYNKKLSLVVNVANGYYVNDVTTIDPASNNTDYQKIATIDSLYIWSTANSTAAWCASPLSSNNNIINLMKADRYGGVGGGTYYSTGMGVRPVVCLNSNIPAEIGTTTDFAI